MNLDTLVVNKAGGLLVQLTLQEPLPGSRAGVVYHVWRRARGGPWERGGEIGGGSLLFVDEAAESDLDYEYDVTLVIN